MKVLYFKTDIKNQDQIESIKKDLNHALGFREWSLDLEDKTFKVEVLTTSPDEIIGLFKRLGVNSKAIYHILIFTIIRLTNFIKQS